MTTSLAQRKVLVLNKSMTAIRFETLEKALKKVCRKKPKAEIVEMTYHDETLKLESMRSMTWEDWLELAPKDGEDCMRTVSRKVRIPTVIRLVEYNKLPNQKVRYNRRTIYHRDGNTCQYCGARPGRKELSIDHVIPRSQGGLTTWENVVVACTKCNTKKANRTPKQAGMKLRRQPTKPKYNYFPESSIRVRDWDELLGQAYYNVTLDNDMGE